MAEKKLETKHLVCKMCDNDCPLAADLEDGKLIRLRGSPDPDAICGKVKHCEEFINHPMRVVHPLKNVGSKRGEQKWEQISWEQALDEIAERLTKIFDQYGPESLLFTGSETNTGRQQGMIRRFANCLGTPNYFTGQHLCRGNTAQVHRCTYGGDVAENWTAANCLLFVGHHPHKNNWASEYSKMKKALARGAKLIVLDPRKTPTSEMADIHLPLRYGTDSAMFLGFLNVIINEELYNKEIVAKYTVGFEDLKARVQEYPLDRVAEITGCDPEMIAAAARMYATEGPSIIPWSTTLDMQVNSTSALRCQDIMMSICGYLGVSEIIGQPSPDIENVSKIELYEKLPEEQKKKLIGTEKYPLFSYKGYELLREANKRVYGLDYYNLLASFMANPPLTFEAMRTGKPYPIKALFNAGGNTLMSYGNQKGIYEGMMNLDLVVVFDHYMTPTAQMADYLLPSNYFLERIGLRQLDHIPMGITQQQVFEPRGEARYLYDVIKGLADRMGIGEDFPWKDFEEVINWRIQKTGKTFDEYSQTHIIPPSKVINYFESDNGFATPSGKIELSSSVLRDLGYDPLPYYREPAQTHISNPVLAKEYPLMMFVGLRDPHNYLTNLRQIKDLRKKQPWPEAYMHSKDVAKYGLTTGQWIWAETTTGRMKLRAKADDDQPEGTLRLPHGWWCPELPGGPETDFSGAMIYNDGMLLPDDESNLDREQGVLNLRGGILAKVYPADAPEHFTEEGPDVCYYVTRPING